MRGISEGGRARLPSLLATSTGGGRLLRAVTLAALCLVVGGMAQGQTPQELRQARRAAALRRLQAARVQNQADRPQTQAVRPQNPPVTPVRPNAIRKAAQRQQDKVAQDLLRKMIRPTTDYVGEMVTQVAAQGNFPLQQTIKGDAKGRTLVTFTNGSLAGDMLLVTPGEVRNYHHNTGFTDVALWPDEGDDHEKRMFAAIRSGLYTAQVVGSEQIAGRQATIVELLPVGGVGEPGPGRPRFKFWIDPETGIQLKNEKSDAMGRVISHRYLTSINAGPNVLTPQDFNLKQLGMTKLNPLFPKDSQYHSLEQAQGHLPFIPVVPQALPNGFQLSGVWIFPGNNSQMQFVLMRFTDGVTSFSLYEHVVPPTAKTPPVPSFNRHIERWRVPGAHGDIEATYTGMLTPKQVQAIYDSLK